MKDRIVQIRSRSSSLKANTIPAGDNTLAPSPRIQLKVSEALDLREFK